MSVKRGLIITLVACTLAAVFPVSGYAADNGEDWTIYFRPGVRFGTDDRTLFIMDFLVPLYRDDKNILFFNPKLTPDDLDGLEANLGIGYRRLLFADKVIVGGNVFYDTRRTGWGTYWDQIGVGAEAMAEFNKYLALTARFNYYIPLTDPRVVGYAGGGGGGTGYFFRTGGIWTGGGGAGGETVEEAPEGFDGEVGFRVPVVSDYVETWVYVGGYHYRGSHIGTIDGVSARLELIPTDFVRLSYEYRKDRTTQGDHFGEVAFEVPFSVESLFAGKNPFEGLGKRLTGSRDMKERMVEPVRRDVDIRVVRVGTGSAGTDTMVEGVVFVSEDAENIPGTPDGTFEHPFASIDAAMTAINSGGAYAGITAIHIINDSDTHTAGGGTASLASLMIWGSGQPHPTFGIITNQMSGYPTVADELILSGGAIDVFGTTYAGSNGITVNGANANIHHNYFTGNYWSIGVYSGSAAITDNFIGGGADGLTPTRSGIYAGGGSISSISRNTITASSNGGGYGIYFNTVPTVTGTVISDNIISVDDTMGTLAAGILFSNCGPITGTTITSNTVTVAVDNTGYAYGIGAIFGTGDYGFEIGSNSITVNGAAVGAWGIDLDTPGGSITADIHDNPLVTVSGAGDSYGIGLSAGRSIYASITGNDLSGGISGAGTTDGVYGIQLITDGHPISETYDITGLGGGDLLISNNNLGGAGVRATGAYGYACGIDIYSRAGNLYALISNGGGITGNTIIADGSDLSGTEVAWADGIVAETREDLAATITGGSIISTGLASLGIGLVSDLADVDAEISVPTISATGTNNEADGIYLEAGNGDIDLAVTDTAITVNAPNSIAYGIAGGAGYDLTASVSGGSISASGRGADGIELFNYSGILDVDISVPTISATGTYTAGTGFYATGIILQSLNDAIDMTVTDTNITAIGTTNTRSRGINANGYLGITALISGGSITSTGRRAEGIYLGTTGTGSVINADISNLTLNVTGTNTSGSGADTYATGIYLSAANGIIDATLTGNDVTVANTSSFWARGIYGTAYGNITAHISGGRISTSGGSAFGIRFDTSTTSSGNIDADISVPTIIATGGGNGMESHGIWLRTYNSGNIDADIYGITGMTVSATYGLARGISIESGGALTGAVYGNTMSVSGMRTASSPYFYPTGVYLRAYTDVGTQASPFLMYNNSLTVTNVNTSPAREAFGFAINYDTWRGQSYGDNVYALIYNNTIAVTGGTGSFGYGAVGGLIAARNLIGYNGAAGAPTIISGNTVTLNSNVAALGFMLYRRNAATPGNGSYVDFNNGAYGGANTVTGTPSLYNTSPFSMGHPGYYSNFYWGTTGTLGNARDYIFF